MIDVTALHMAALAAIHAEAFEPDDRWDAAAFAEMFAMPGAFGRLDPRGGLALARRAGGEVELLTLAVAPAARRQGIGRALVAAVLAAADGPVFLEAAADNEAALALYAQAGFVPCGRRRDYYSAGRDAIVLRNG